jgi:phosphoribosylanthranilate isomerase
VGEGFDPDAAALSAQGAAGLLVDAHRPEAPGGTGRTFDWKRVAGLSTRVPFLVLAGGLDARNVAEAIETVRPKGVDVSTGVESAPGRKDAAKMRAFVEASRAGLVRREAW